MKILKITNFIIILISFFVANSFAQTSNTDSIKLTKYLEIEDKMWDSICIAQTKIAKEEISKGKLTLVIPKGMVEMYESDSELDSILSRYNIKTMSQGIFCTAPSDKQFCYGDLMNNEIERRFGQYFIEEKRSEAEKAYVRKNINKIFSSTDCDRNHSIYPFTKNLDDFLEKYDKDYFKTFLYPQDYIHRKENDLYSWTTVRFVLTVNGELKNLRVDSSFRQPYNEKFNEEFNERAINFVKKIKWIPNKKRGITVNSDESVTFMYDHENWKR
ncbi:energy transducer TonB [Chryseobacterium terrae]|uniref:TonB protein C-terminal n=1 Tax=Chryseobacterium terrae TaxID=3163299 RepID=A0ABW8Y588_9FLAO